MKWVRQFCGSLFKVKRSFWAYLYSNACVISVGWRYRTILMDIST